MPESPTFLYSIGGTPVEVDRELSMVTPLESGMGARPVVRVRACKDLPPNGDLIREVYDRKHGRSSFTTFESEKGLQWTVASVGRFAASADGNEVWYDPEPDALNDDVEQVLLGPVLGMALQCAGRPLLHASAVLRGGSAMAFSAPSGTGKSTLAAWFGQAGHELVADDLLPVDVSGCHVNTTVYVPRLKLWDDAVTALGEDSAQFETVMSWVPKRNIKGDGTWGRYAKPRTYPLGAVYLLSPTTAEVSPIIEPLPFASAAVRLASSMYMAEALSGRRLLSAFEAGTSIARTTPVRVVTYQHGYAGLPALVEAISADVDRILECTR